MSFFSLLAALLLEHFQPLASPDAPRVLFQRLAQALEKSLNAGQRLHGALAWLLAVVPVVVVAAVVHFALAAVSGLLAWGWDVVVLYLCMGFKHDTHLAGTVAHALKAGEMERARAALAESGDPVPAPEAGREPDQTDIARMTMARLVDRAQRHVFGVLAWFVILAPFGPVGALLYRAGDALGDEWGGLGPHEPFGAFAAQAQRVFQWLPARLVAASYAVVGNFEDAMYGWRGQAGGAPASDIVLGAAAGALGLRLGNADSGADPEADDIESAVGLIWRAVMLWLAVALLITLGSWLNG